MKPLLIGCLILAGATARAVSPEDAAMAHIEAMRASTNDWKDKTAIFPGTTKEKQLAIRTLLIKWVDQLKEGELEVIDSKTDDEVAAVMVSQSVGFDPEQVRVHPIALLKRDDDWEPTPVPGSFENTGIRYQPALSAKARRLETWMQSEKSRHLTRLRRELMSDLADQIQSSLSRDELIKNPPAEILLGFIEACQALHTPLALAYLGGLQDPLPEDWRNTVSLTARAFHAPLLSGGNWSDLTSPNTFAVELETEADDEHAAVTIGLFNPTRARPNTDEWAVRYFSLQRQKEGPWRIDLPMWLLQDDDDFANALIDDDLYEQCPRRLISTIEPGEFESPIDLMDSFLSSLSAAEFPRLLAHLSQSISDVQSAELLGESARLWRNFSSDDEIPLRLAVHTAGNHAWGIYGSFDSKRPRVPDSSLLHLQMKKDGGNWAVISAVDPEDVAEVPDELLKWADEALLRDEDEWLAELGFDQRLGGLAAADAPGKEAAQAVAEAWTRALKSAQPRSIFSTITGFDDDQTTRHVFSFLGQELGTPCEYEIVGIHRHGRWAGATIRHRTLTEPTTEHWMLHPIVVTPGGPRVMPEAILFNATNRAQRYLNESVWRRLRGRLPEATVAELEVLHEAHDKLCESLKPTE